MPHLQSASLRPSLLALAIVSTLPGVTFAAASRSPSPPPATPAAPLKPHDGERD
ncbi:hypothetical protein ACVXG7_17790 [Enterobacter hormaechei]